MKQQRSSNKQKHFWARVVMRKWLNIETPRFKENEGDEDEDTAESNDLLPRLRRQKSSTFRSQYINNKEVRVCAGTWNVGGKLPTDDLDIDDWLGTNNPADIYVLGFQEIVPLNPGNIFGAEDTRPVPKWENIIRETLNRVRPLPRKVKSFTDPPSPSKFKRSDDVPDIVEEMLLESDSDIGEEVHPLDEENNIYVGVTDKPTSNEVMNTNLPASDAADLARSREPLNPDLQRQFSYAKRLNRLNCIRDEESTENIGTPISQQTSKLSRMVSGTERIGLSWPEPPLHLLDRPTSFKSIKSFKTSKSFRTYTSFKTTIDEIPDLLGEIDLEALMKRKRRSPYVRIVSKQMVGIFITIWVRRSLRKHIQNLKVSNVGVGVMGYIGNKGSISISMSIYQTLFCFICTHLTPGEKEGDEHKRNADVHEIHQRTHFHSLANIGLPRSILDHEKIIWLGDLNYRINLSYEKTRDLISTKQWSKLLEKDQLSRELKKGVFGGWSEGTVNFPPTYKYENNSDKYYGGDSKVGRRTPSWCDRVLSYGKGVRLLNYGRVEIKMSDHRPVTATYMAEVEVFSQRKLQRALTFTDAEVENEEIKANLSSWN
ncbi:hypothetical protein TanjilG_04734 [Lupinus angustifolius]|uniref:Inositol polyphosphate-related phosphatase domain-containing protein n=1 Tax=Lupinus angustifolius TaxID=3871 RepID=A0A4P1RK25_LUPAN|nr:hypothetical protein TanjilG_04734 [Lupinus angustifolius]